MSAHGTFNNPQAPENQGRLPNYAWISLVAFLCAVVVLLLLIVNVEKLSRFGLLQQVYYLVLVVTGLAAAGFLFGAMQSTATWESKALGGTLRLSGSVVGAALVVFGGYQFLPKLSYFPLTVYVHGLSGPQELPLRNTGRVFLKLGQEINSESVADNGQAVFPRVPAEFRGQQVAAWVEPDDYQAVSPTITINDENVDLVVEKKIKQFKLAGTISDEGGNPLEGVDVRVALTSNMASPSSTYESEKTTKRDGRFDFQVPADSEQTVDLTASKPGYQTKRLSPTLGDSGVNLSLKRKKNAIR